MLLRAERKSVEPMAAMTAPARMEAQHQSLLHFVGQGNWSDEKVLTKAREIVVPKIEAHGPITAWIIDDTGFPKKGEKSTCVARQYCGFVFLSAGQSGVRSLLSARNPALRAATYVPLAGMKISIKQFVYRLNLTRG